MHSLQYTKNFSKKMRLDDQSVFMYFDFDFFNQFKHND